MKPSGTPPGDQAKASVRVDVSPSEAFRVFTEEIDQWWRRGIAYRIGGTEESVVRLEPQLGGRLFETYRTPGGERVVETGRVAAWEPPSRLVLEWRAVNFAPHEKTEVEVTFAAAGGSSTLVTVTHRGWSDIRPDHPVRHGNEIPAFIRMMGMWWADLLTSLRLHTAHTASGRQESEPNEGNAG